MRLHRVPTQPLAEVWSTNPLERVNKEIKRRARVVGIFPNEAAVTRLVGAILHDMHDDRVFLLVPSSSLRDGTVPGDGSPRGRPP